MTPQPPSFAPDTVQAKLIAMIQGGTLPDLKWSNFSDYQERVNKFYGGGGYALAWVQNGPTPQALAMIALFKNAQLKGLNPDDYDSPRWDGRVAKITPQVPKPPDADLVNFDLALTVCAMRFISNLRVGRVNPSHFKFAINLGPLEYDLPDHLRSQVIGAADVAAVIAQVEPPYDGYRRAEAALAVYLKLAAEGDGQRLPEPARPVRSGKPYEGMPQLIARLHQLGDLPASEDSGSSDSIYQGAVVKAVKVFQRRHGLEQDGKLNAGTVAELNKPLAYRVQQLQIALERYRWVAPNFPEPPILVNIPEFKLRTLRHQKAEFLTMPVVVGRAYRAQTPVFTDRMRYVIFRPYWNVPVSIQRRELVPKTERNRNYLVENRYQVVERDGTVVSDGEVTDDILARLRSGSLGVRQKPGPKNALGLAKFIFPNNYNIYLHSTPAPALFARARRDFSHGCIRVSDPTGLAAWVLRGKAGWNRDRIKATMNGTVDNVQVNLDNPIPVLILYGTAVVEPDNEVRFFDDIYGYDAALQKVLDAGPPYPT
jgi:murein L,D-transpeptidase YcbB/YkuD